MARTVWVVNYAACSYSSLLTNNNEDMKYKPYVAEIEMTIVMKTWSPNKSLAVILPLCELITF